MLSGSKPQNNEAVESGTNSMQFRAASAGYTSDREMIGELVKRLGGEHALLEQLTAVLEDGVNPSMRDVNEDTEGYCYLRLFDRVEHADAARMGINPTVAEIRRFSNGRAAPFGLRQVVVIVQGSPSGRLAHVKFHGGIGGLRPVEALAALAKDCRVGGLPDGVSEDFPSDWIPAKVDVALTWSFLRPGEATRALDLLEWVGSEPPWLDKLYEPISAATSRVQWVLRADPLGPLTATIDVIDGNGKVQVARTWSSYVGHTGYHQGFKVRGGRVYAEAKIWRAAKVLTDPTSPAPKPTPPPGHGDLLVKTFCKGGFDAGKNSQNTHVVPTVSADTPGFCYSNAFVDGADAIWSLGAYPTVGAIRSYLESLRSSRPADGDESFKRKAWLDSGSHLRAGKNVFHVSGERGQGATAFWDHFHELPDSDVVGATQADVLRNDPMENVALAPTLSIRPKASGTVMSVPFVAILGTGKEFLFWDVSGGKKFASLSSYFESVELVSLRVKATVHRGDNDTLLTVAADTVDQPMQSDTDWIGAAHTLHVSGNVNGATNGELVLEGNHGFGVQLKGVSVGNPTPIIQAKLETAVAATAYLKIILTVRVAGTGIPVAMVLPTRAAKGGMNGITVRRRDDEDNE